MTNVRMIDDPLIGIEGDLKIITLEPGKVEGEFLTTNDYGRGVYFLSEVKEDSRFLLITTAPPSFFKNLCANYITAIVARLMIYRDRFCIADIAIPNAIPPSWL